MADIHQIRCDLARVQGQLTELIDALAVPRPYSKVDLRRSLVMVRGGVQLVNLQLGQYGDELQGWLRSLDTALNTGDGTYKP